MTTVGLFEAKQKLSELVERARKGEEIGITRHGTLVARIVAAPEADKPTWHELFSHPEKYRIRLKPGVRLTDEMIKELINEGRR